VLTTTIKRTTPAWLQSWIKRVHYPLHRAKLRLEWRKLDRADRGAAFDVPLPPARLRFRVDETARADAFVSVGRQTAENLKAAIAKTNFRLQPGATVLDFGCGCGRTLLWLAKEFPEVQWHGTDVDAEAIEWCRHNLKSAVCSVNESYPPLDYPENKFDLIYAVSVFTHLDADYQRAWLADLARILRPGGLLMASFHSRSVWEPLEAAQAVRKYGFAFRTSDKLKGILPGWYHTSFRDQASVEKLLAEYLDNVTYLEGQLGAQDLAIASKSATTPARRRASRSAS
jgi:cyclopropane fatty-acyl-phospholipid synthase-like methyltransferase